MVVHEPAAQSMPAASEAMRPPSVGDTVTGQPRVTVTVQPHSACASILKETPFSVSEKASPAVNSAP